MVRLIDRHLSASESRDWLDRAFDDKSFLESLMRAVRDPKTTVEDLGNIIDCNVSAYVDHKLEGLE